MATEDYKWCRDCEQDKHVDEFYKQKNGKPYIICKTCFRAYSKNTEHHHRSKIVNFSEKVVIDRLTNVHIPALPGKALGYSWTDVVAWGCVMIECKYSSDRGGLYHWGFSPTQYTQGVRAHLIVLCMEHDEGRVTFHVFDAKDPVFYNNKGKRKTGIAYIENPQHRKGTQVVLTKELMESHKDKWSLVEQYRLYVAMNLSEAIENLHSEKRTN